MIILQIFRLFILIYFQFFIVNSVNYVHFEIDGILNRKYQFNLTIFIQDFKGIVIYAIDSKKNRFLVELEEENDRKMVIFKYNNFNVKETSERICGCLKCEGVFMTLIMELDQSQIVVQCNNAKNNIINFTSSFKWPEQFYGYPIPRQINISNKIFVWMGNIGPYNGYKDVIYMEMKNQLVGCIHEIFFFDERVVIPNVKKSLFAVQCTKNTKYNKCHAFKYNQINNTYYTFLANVSLLPGQLYTMDSKKLDLYGFPIGINLITNNWDFKQNSCLLEILFKKKISVLFFINESQDIEILTIKHRIFGCFRHLSNSKIQKFQNFFIDFRKNQLVIHIQNNGTVESFLEEILFLPSEIKVGSFHREKICTYSNKTINFNYRNQIMSVSAVTPTWVLIEIDKLLILTFSIVIVISIIISITIWAFNQKSVGQNCIPDRSIPHVGTESRHHSVMECTNISTPLYNFEIYDEIQ